MSPIRFVWVLAAMTAAMALVGVLAWWDESRDADAALEDFAQQQTVLARGAASTLSANLAAWQRTGAAGTDVPRAAVLAGLARVESPGAIMLAVASPDGRLVTLDGRAVDDPELAAAMAGGRSTLRIERAAAAKLGLPERVAMAGLARLDAGPLGQWGVVAVASAFRERDRDRRDRMRLFLSMLLAGAVVLGFGTMYLRHQRREIARERDERLERLGKMATLVTLASGVAHEVSTPLGVIVGRAEQLLPRVKDDERSTRAVQVVLDQAEHISQIVRGFLTLARDGTPTVERVSPHSVVSSALALVEHRFQKAGVSLKSGVRDDLPSIGGDRRLLEHALVNLLLNACDATPRTGHVEVAARADGAELAIDVVDDGVGITPENAARATEPFFTTKPAGQGTGLGLAIANEIVKSHRGTLSIAPGTPKGTRASLRIPLADGGAHAAH